jgi:phosphoserine phosphatase RsbU/P
MQPPRPCIDECRRKSTHKLGVQTSPAAWQKPLLLKPSRQGHSDGGAKDLRSIFSGSVSRDREELQGTLPICTAFPYARELRNSSTIEGTNSHHVQVTARCAVLPLLMGAASMDRVATAPSERPIIWVVDDSPTQAAITKRSLGDDFDCTCFADGTTLIEKLQSTRRFPDLVLLDWVMPELSGDEVCRIVRANERTHDIPIVIVTASRTDTSDIVSALASGANDYLAKPFVAAELRARVDAILRAASAKRAAERERKRLQHIADLGRALFAAGADVRAVMTTLADALVFAFCDGCVVSLTVADRSLEPVMRHRDAPVEPHLVHFATFIELGRFDFPDAHAARERLPRSCAPYVDACGLRQMATLDIPLRALAQGRVTLLNTSDDETEDGDLLAIQACLDITGLALQAALRSEAERAMTRFQEEVVGIVSHDLRSPLGAMSVGISVLKHSLRTEAEPARILGHLDNSTRRMSAIVDQLLDVTRARLGKGITISRTIMELSETVGSIVDELRLAHPSVRFSLLSKKVSGVWDPDRLGQVVANLIGNAVAYGRQGGPVTVEVTGDDKSATVVVFNENRAEPIANAALARLFEPFERGENRSGSGLGLGLYIVREIVRAHGGCVIAESDESGTAFRITLPRSEP